MFSRRRFVRPAYFLLSVEPHAFSLQRQSNATAAPRPERVSDRKFYDSPVLPTYPKPLVTVRHRREARSRPEGSIRTSALQLADTVATTAISWHDNAALGGSARLALESDLGSSCAMETLASAKFSAILRQVPADGIRAGAVIAESSVG